MPLGIINDQEFESELSNCICNSDIPTSIKPRAPESPQEIPSNSDSNLIPTIPIAEIIDIKARGRGLSNVEVPSSLRKIIGETSAINGRAEALDLASMMGISKSSVSAYKEGAHSTASINEPNVDTKNHITNAKERVSNRARKKLHLALSHINEDKLAEAKVGEIASVAKAMSGIIKDMEPDIPLGNPNESAPRFLIYAPQIKNENNYETIYSKE